MDTDIIMNINNPSQDDIVEAATALGGALLIIGAGISVYTGVLEVPLAWEIIVVALGILGFHEAGRRRGKKSALIKWGLEQLDDAGERQGVQQGTPADHSAAETMEAAGYVPSNPDASATPSESADTDTRIETAGYQDLRAVAAAVGVTPGQHPTIEGLRSALRSADSGRVSEEFDAIESGRDE